MSSRDQADFTVRLIDKVKGPAKSATKATERLIAANKRLAKSERGVMAQRRRASKQNRDQGGRFTKGGGGGGPGGVFKNALGVLGGNLMTSAVMKMAGLVAELGRAGAEMVTFGQNSRLAFSNLTKHGVPAEKLFEHSRALAKRFGLDVMDTTDQYKKFLALQFTPKGADKLIRMGADLRALGTDAEGVQGVFTALGQIKGKGRLQGDELLQLSERGVSTKLVQEEIGKLIGGAAGPKDSTEVQKLIQSGKVDADTALQAIENAINRKLGQSSLGESGAKFADQTIEGMLGRIKAIGQDAGLTMVDKIAAPITKLVGKGLNIFEGWLGSSEGAATIQKIADGLGKAADFALTLSDAFGSAFGETFQTSIKPMFAAFDMFGDGTSTAQALGKALGEVTAFAIGTAATLTFLGGGLVAILGPLYEVGKAITIGLLEPIGEMGANAILWFDNLFTVFGNAGLTLSEKAWEVGKLAVTGMANGIKALWNYPADALTAVGEKAITAVKGVFDIHSPSRVTMDVGMNVGRGLAQGMGNSERLVTAASDRLAGAGGMEERLYGPEAPSFATPPAANENVGRGGGPITVTINQEISSGGNAEEVARTVARETRREIEAFFRQTLMETA